MTPRLLTCGEGETVELPMVTEKLSVLDSVNLEPIRRISVLSVFNLRKLEDNQDFMSVRQSARDEGGRVEVGLLER